MEAETQVTPQLLRYLARMGEPLFLAQPPTGYPDVGSSWISPDMLLTRMNFAADLVANRVNGARLQAPPADAQTFVRLIAPDALSSATRAALAETAGPDAAGAASRRAGISTEVIMNRSRRTIS